MTGSPEADLAGTHRRLVQATNHFQADNGLSRYKCQGQHRNEMQTTRTAGTDLVSVTGPDGLRCERAAVPVNDKPRICA